MLLKSKIIFLILVIILSVILLFNLQVSLAQVDYHDSKSVKIPIYIDAEFKHNPVMENSFTLLNVSIYTDWIKQRLPPSEFVDIYLLINTNLTVYYEGKIINKLNLRFYWKEGSDIFGEKYYRIFEKLSFIVFASLPSGDYPLSVSIIHDNWSYTVNKILSVRKPVEITFYITDEHGHPLNVINVQIVSKNKGTYTPQYVEQGKFYVIIPEGGYNITLNYKYYLFDIIAEHQTSMYFHDSKSVTLTLDSGINLFVQSMLITSFLYVLLVALIIVFSNSKFVLISAVGSVLGYFAGITIIYGLLSKGNPIVPPNLGLGSLLLTLCIPLVIALIYGIVFYYLLLHYKEKH
jgi:hypothetical protein